MESKNLPATKPESTPAHSSLANPSIFKSAQNFELAQRMAGAFAASNLVPKEYQNNTANALIALEIAGRIGASPLMVAQNLHIVHGRPSWSSAFIIGALNSCGRFKPLKFKMEGTGKTRSCTAHTVDVEGELIEGPAVTMEMAEAEGWVSRTGSKWKTMPDLMLRYRAAAFFGRLYAPDILMGMRSVEEQDDSIDVTPSAAPSEVTGENPVADMNEKIKQRKAKADAAPKPENDPPPPPPPMAAAPASESPEHF